MKELYICQFCLHLFFQLSLELIVGCLPFLVKHLKAKSHVVHSYAAHCLEKIFTLKNPQGKALYVSLFLMYLYGGMPPSVSYEVLLNFLHLKLSTFYFCSSPPFWCLLSVGNYLFYLKVSLYLWKISPIECSLC